MDASRPLLAILSVTGQTAVSFQLCFRAKKLFTTARSLGKRQGLFWPYYTVLVEGAVGHGVNPVSQEVKSVIQRVKSVSQGVKPVSQRVKTRSPIYSIFAVRDPPRPTATAACLSALATARGGRHRGHVRDALTGALSHILATGNGPPASPPASRVHLNEYWAATRNQPAPPN